MRKIIFGSILAIFILLMSPSIPAIEYNTILDENELKVFQKIKNIEMDINDLKKQLNNVDLTELNEKIDIKHLKEKIEKIDFISSFKEYKYKNLPTRPNCIIILLLKIILTIISKILSLGVNILFTIIDNIVVIFKILILVPVTIIQNIIAMLIYIIDMIIDTIKDIITPQ